MEQETDLESYLTNLIAEGDGVKPEEVTVEYIEEQRKKRIYPNTRFNIYSSYVCGGVGLAHFTKNEFDEIKVLIDDILERI